ncbi:alkane 1-monooxygenase [Leptospira idonii]|uniref:Alkane 1-monooxygenase n=1 Tax=Leptospira idonii TaxID=1193500 RepID=A0A4R9LXJ7_9LEPT|nr:alkane 1-monooxygenase [Leptospira idonii]TGN18135.1 alkane 1-monooxygenase [Leptospira idonii]
MKKLSFLIAFILPITSVCGFYLGTYWNLLTPFFVFVLLPVLDLAVGKDESNPEEIYFLQLQKEDYYKIITFLWTFVQTCFLIWALYVVAVSDLGTLDAILFTASVGLVTGGIGITVAHELGHKNSRVEQFLSKLLLLQVSYLHFYIEHNRGHHVNVATEEDPASSKENESFYRFYPRTVVGSYLSAWRLESVRLNRSGLSFFHYKNEMIQFTFFQFIGIALIFCFSWALQETIVWEGFRSDVLRPVLFFLAQSVFGFSLLEAVNYVEHYGLQRKKQPSGKFERVMPIHSWNQNYFLSNAFLFQLQRHSDHHANAGRRYQTLRHYEEAPQLPFGYELMILIALVPPLWFKIVNPILEEWKSKSID